MNTTEAVFLKHWLETNVAHLNDLVINLVYSRLSSMLQEKVLDEGESLGLLNLLHGFVGLPIASTEQPNLIASIQQARATVGMGGPCVRA